MLPRVTSDAYDVGIVTNSPAASKKLQPVGIGCSCDSSAQICVA